MVDKLVTFLEMTSPDQLRPAAPVAGLEIVRATDPAGVDAARIRALHDVVATSHHWSSLALSDEQWRRRLEDPDASHWIVTVDGTEIGWASLEVTDDHGVEIASFGLRPEVAGRGYGGASLTELVRRAWTSLLPPAEHAPTSPVGRRVWLHTSSWDHPRALANYLARGFTVTRRELQRQQAGSDDRDAVTVDEPPRFLVRPTVAGDAPSVAALVADLGYELSLATTEERLRRSARSPDDVVAVAVEGGASVVGVIAGHIVPLFAETGDAFCRITALSVAPRVVRHGVGRRLVEFAEYFASVRDCQLVEVSSGRRDEREAAHRFYPAIGFEDASASSTRYWKRIGDEPR